MITKVTSDNYKDYTLLFNQADTALKEYNGEPTSEFIEVGAADSFNPDIQYFNFNYSPITFAANDEYETATEAFEGRDLSKKWYRLNEQIIYDLETYFGRLELLKNIDYSFLRLPIDEPTFDIIDDKSKGRRIIQVPKEFASGISVQGDETAEILFFSIDRYYDATDLWDSDMNYIIQWETGGKKGITKAFINKDSRPFAQENGKLYFGWPISSEITETAGNIIFSVRIFKFSGEENEDKPKLSFGLNTQTATVKINPSIAYTISGIDEFEDIPVISKTSDLIKRVQNSTIISKASQDMAAEPQIIRNILPNDTLNTALSVKTIAKTAYVLAMGDFNENETYYNADYDEHGNREVVTGLNENIYRPGVYYVARNKVKQYYEFNYETIKNKIDQIQAIVPSGIITYTANSCNNPTEEGIGGTYQFIAEDEFVYIPVKSETILPNRKYYEFNEATQKFVAAIHIATTTNDDSWLLEDRNTNKEKENGKYPCKYFERISPKLIIDENNPVGCYWITANTNEAKKTVNSAESYRIWIPGPEDLTEEDVLDSSGVDGYKRIIINPNEDSVTLSVQATAPANNIIKYNWTAEENNVSEQELTNNVATQTLHYDENEDLALINDFYTVKCYSSRNKEDSDEKIERIFRVTAPAQKFVFDTVADSEGEISLSSDSVKIISHNYDDDNARLFQIDFSENLDNQGNLKMVSDKVAYRFRRRVGGDSGSTNIFVNDEPAVNWTNDFVLVDSYEEIPALEIPFEEIIDNETGQVVGSNDHYNDYFYCEIINIVNEDFDLVALNNAANEVKRNNALTRWWEDYEPRIARTPYYRVQN